MKATEVIRICKLLELNNVGFWLDGGWAVDALVGKQTRRHKDLDIAVRHKDVSRLRSLLESAGYKDAWSADAGPYNFVLRHENGHELDIHSFELDSHGNNAIGVAYNADHLGGRGIVKSYKVRCINPKALVQFHTGYAVDENDHRDVLALCNKFDIELPEQHRHWAERQRVKGAIHSMSLLPDRPRIIAISGFGGSGKSTLAAWLKTQLGNTEVVGADDFIVDRAKQRGPDWSSYDRLRLKKQVLEPARTGRPIRYQVYDWRYDRLGAWRNVTRSAYLIVEGLSILHPDLLPFYDFSIWVDCRLQIATKRGIDRDRQAGNDHDDLWLNVWMPNEKEFFSKYQPDKLAHFVYAS